MSDPQEMMLKSYSKVANYTVMAILIANTLSSMRRFRDVPHDELITRAYEMIKAQATALS